MLSVNALVYSTPPWFQLMRKLLGTHLGHSSIYNMCCMMQDVKLVCQLTPFTEFKINKQYFWNAWNTMYWCSCSMVNVWFMLQKCPGSAAVEECGVLCGHGTVGVQESSYPQAHLLLGATLISTGNTGPLLYKWIVNGYEFCKISRHNQLYHFSVKISLIHVHIQYEPVLQN